MKQVADWFEAYNSEFFDEVFDQGGKSRKHYAEVISRLVALSPEDFRRRQALTELAFRNQGITFAVYGDPSGPERPFPLDIVPRIIPAAEWKTVEQGLIQRVKALNLFLQDIYNGQHILSDNVLPQGLVLNHPAYYRQVHGVRLPHGAFTHVAGIDLVRDETGQYRVLEDNLRTPSGVSYVLSNRRVMSRAFPQILSKAKVKLVEDYPDMLLKTLRSLSPRDIAEPNVVILTPGPFNSAYFEHMFLAQQMGVELVEAADLFVDDGRVWMRSTGGRQQVDVIYKRIDDEFIDPTVFRPDSVLGVPGLVKVYREGRVALANAVGNGVADDKALYAYVPRLIKYYLNQEPILPNVQTYIGAERDDLEYILAHAHELVIKKVDQSGGYGMLIGPHSTEEQVAEYVKKVREEPHNFVAQPTLGLSTHPTYAEDTAAFEPRHIDLRPFVLVGEKIQVLPGGLTRVALKRGSLVVNSSQGGGSKDTWVLS
ncbi:MAG: circularly permuted type 2 ATP-grasp protein [Meiothermus sp.]|nr:circularly permuted type 2 ATP-grasp protein [Meiothermus sp.]